MNDRKRRAQQSPGCTSGAPRRREGEAPIDVRNEPNPDRARATSRIARFHLVEPAADVAEDGAVHVELLRCEELVSVAGGADEERLDDVGEPWDAPDVLLSGVGELLVPGDRDAEMLAAGAVLAPALQALLAVRAEHAQHRAHVLLEHLLVVPALDAVVRAIAVDAHPDFPDVVTPAAH